jgi:hypothetical protein
MRAWILPALLITLPGLAGSTNPFQTQEDVLRSKFFSGLKLGQAAPYERKVKNDRGEERTEKTYTYQVENTMKDYFFVGIRMLGGDPVPYRVKSVNLLVSNVAAKKLNGSSGERMALAKAFLESCRILPAAGPGILNDLAGPNEAGTKFRRTYDTRGRGEVIVDCGAASFSISVIFP